MLKHRKGYAIRIPSQVPGLAVTKEEPFLVLEAKDEGAFLEVLSPITGFGANAEHRQLIYRGQEDDWPLIPVSRRKSNWPSLFGITGPKDTLHWRLTAEAETLLAFCQMADYQGLRIPNLDRINDSILGFLTQLQSRIVNNWPPPEATPALALAQHNGIPTCLLDFTRNPFIASYFAVRAVFTGNQESKGDLCVWVIADPTYTSREGLASRVKVVIPPASDNHTLQRQEGLLAYSPLESETADLQGEYCPDRPLEEVIAEQSPKSLAQVRLKRSFAPMLLHQIIKLGYDSSRLFPTFDGVVRCLHEYEWARMGPPRLWAGSFP
ncbi:MAG: FRG domain-containing protein [Acidobacteriaceae bacterium]|nr:FRG domain-containing protein [Acidobacteriaceae bacterium]